MYIPDWSIVRQAQAYDPALSIRWIDSIHRWGVYRRTQVPSKLYDRDVLVMIVQGPRGSFMPLDQRLLDRLRANDLQARGRVVLDELIRKQEQAQRTKVKDFRNTSEAIARDLAPVMERELGSTFGAVNVPKDDLQMPLRLQQYLEGDDDA